MRALLNKYLDCFVTIRTAQSNFEGILRLDDYDSIFYVEQFIDVLYFNYEKKLGKTYFNIEKIESISVADIEYERVLKLKEEEQEAIRLENERSLREDLTSEEITYFIEKIKCLDFNLFNEDWKIYYFEEMDYNQNIEEIRVDKNNELYKSIDLKMDEENSLPNFIKSRIKFTVKNYKQNDPDYNFNPFLID